MSRSSLHWNAGSPPPVCKAAKFLTFFLTAESNVSTTKSRTTRVIVDDVIKLKSIFTVNFRKTFFIIFLNDRNESIIFRSLFFSCLRHSHNLSCLGSSQQERNHIGTRVQLNKKIRSRIVLKTTRENQAKNGCNYQKRLLSLLIRMFVLPTTLKNGHFELCRWHLCTLYTLRVRIHSHV